MQGSLRLGLTGGMGSGKSTVADFFAKLGAAVIDADAISRRVTAPRGAAIAQLAVEFGADFINSDHALDRDGVGGRVDQGPGSTGVVGAGDSRDRGVDRQVGG